MRVLADEFGMVKLVPMHTFCVGGDDRYYLAKIALGMNDNRCTVIHKPQNLWELYACYENARACVGMRYHSVVMQTILNGNNFILDYTDPASGKIAGFVKDLKGSEFYSERMIQLQKPGEVFKPSEIAAVLRKGERFCFCDDGMLERYRQFIARCLR